MNEHTHLLSEFAVPTIEEWRKEVERLLKGAPFAARMVTRTLEGFEVSPLYTDRDTADIAWLGSLPGQAPFVRGTHASGYLGAPWLVAQELHCPSCEDVNAALREALPRGQTAINLLFDVAGRRGLDSDQADPEDVGRRGTSINALDDLDVALDGIDLMAHPIQLQAGSAALPAAALVVALLRGRGLDAAGLRGCLGGDVFTCLARLGQAVGPVEHFHFEQALLTRWAADNAPALRTLPIYESPWHEGGADLALSLGLTLGSAVATLRAMENHGIEPAAAAPRFQFNVDMGTDFFLEIAKVRALRLLWSRILTASGVDPAQSGAFVHARTALRCQSLLDQHVNLLRSTTGAMSAVLGGVDSLHISPFDEVHWVPDSFSRRIARNVHLILAHECHFDQVTDPAGGSWYVESLTRDLAAAAWAKFQDVEKKGGMAAALESGWVQEQVAAAAAARAAGFASRRQVMVGTNMYPTAEQPPAPRERRDCELMHQRRSETLNRQRTSATAEAHLLVVTRLENMMECPPQQYFERMVEAVESGATIGELISVTRESGPDNGAVTTIPIRRDAAPFEELRRRVWQLQSRHQSAGRVFVACLGERARYAPRLEFVCGFLQSGGFAVSGTDLATTGPAEVAAAALADGARTVVIVGLDETYAQSAEAVARQLSAAPGHPAILVAGAPGEHERAWRSAGVEGYINLKSNVLDVLNQLATQAEARP